MGCGNAAGRSVLVLGTALLLTTAAAAQELHKNAFSDKATQFIKGEDNVKAEVKVHELSGERSRSLPSSEHIKLNLAAGKNETNFAYFYYPTPPVLLNEDTSAELWVHSNKAGVQLLARVVFPKIRNPKQLDESLTRLVPLDSYKPPAGGWQKLLLKRPGDILQAQKQALRLELKDDPDIADAYIDRLVLNLYAGQGEVEVFLDNLEVGPVRPGTVPPKGKDPKTPGKAVTQEPKPKTDHGHLVEYERGKLTVGGVEAFPRFIRYSGVPLGFLREAGFNSVYMPADTPPAVIEDAINNHRFWVIPNITPIPDGAPDKPLPGLSGRDAEALIANIRKFQSIDGVLFYDLGTVRNEDFRRVSRTIDAIRAADPRRPVGADVWEGFGKYAIPLQLIGTHRDPLLTTLELDKYGQWLNQRRILAAGSRFTWTWIQTHIPEWQTRLLYGKSTTEGFTEPIGPQPEQIRLLTYLALASGCKGLGYWSDRFLSDALRGKDRWYQLALLNQELDMLAPLLQNLSGDVRWVSSSNPQVKVAVLRTAGRGVLALPIALGGGAQFVPSQSASTKLTFTVPLVPDGAEPWELTPVGIHSLQPELKLTQDGVQVTLPDFDLTAAVVFTSDNRPDGDLARWQRQTRSLAPFAASWACDMAEEQFKKVMWTHERLCLIAPPVEDAAFLIGSAQKKLMEARRERMSHHDHAAYDAALAALRPLRILMRTHWEQAVQSLDYPAASPFAVSFYTLPRHWELAHYLREFRLGPTALPDGDFNAARPGDEGVLVSALPGWTVQEVAADEVILDARIVPGKQAKVEHMPRQLPKIPPQYQPTGFTKRVEPPGPPDPPLGAGTLRLKVSPKPVVLEKGEKAPPEPQALESVFLCANSPPAKFQPGSWVQISGWVRVPSPIRASADGAMMFDSVTGEAYAVRLTAKDDWEHFRWYRQVPASGEIRVRLALTGFGTAYFDDIRIEPYVGSENRPFGEPAKLTQGR
jgi:hypothetical protein